MDKRSVMIDLKRIFKTSQELSIYTLHSMSSVLSLGSLKRPCEHIPKVSITHAHPEFQNSRQPTKVFCYNLNYRYS